MAAATSGATGSGRGGDGADQIGPWQGRGRPDPVAEATGATGSGSGDVGGDRIRPRLRRGRLHRAAAATGATGSGKAAPSKAVAVLLLAGFLAAAAFVGGVYLVFRPRMPAFSVASLSICGLDALAALSSPELDAAARADNSANRKVCVDYRRGLPQRRGGHRVLLRHARLAAVNGTAPAAWSAASRFLYSSLKLTPDPRSAVKNTVTFLGAWRNASASSCAAPTSFPNAALRLAAGAEQMNMFNFFKILGSETNLRSSGGIARQLLTVMEA